MLCIRFKQVCRDSARNTYWVMLSPMAPTPFVPRRNTIQTESSSSLPHRRALPFRRLQNVFNPIDGRIVPLSVRRRDFKQVHVFDVREARRVLLDVVADLLLLQQRQREVLRVTPHRIQNVVQLARDGDRGVERQQQGHDLRAAHAALLQRVDDGHVDLLHGQVGQALRVRAHCDCQRASAAWRARTRAASRGASRGPVSTTSDALPKPARF